MKHTQKQTRCMCMWNSQTLAMQIMPLRPKICSRTPLSNRKHCTRQPTNNHSPHNTNHHNNRHRHVQIFSRFKQHNHATNPLKHIRITPRNTTKNTFGCLQTNNHCSKAAKCKAYIGPDQQPPQDKKTFATATLT